MLQVVLFHSAAVTEYVRLSNVQTTEIYSSGDWENQDQGASGFSVWWEPIPRRRRLPAEYFFNGKKSKYAPLNLFYKDTNPIHEGGVHMI